MSRVPVIVEIGISGITAMVKAFGEALLAAKRFEAICDLLVRRADITCWERNKTWLERKIFI